MAEHPVLAGTDGFRGVATLELGPGKMNTETFAGLTYAMLDIALAQTDNPDADMVFVAQDTRPSGRRLRHAAIAAIHAHGLEAVDLEVAPTPAAQKLAQTAGALATVVATASHNPWQDNGWKGMSGVGGEWKPTSGRAKAISDRYWELTESGLVLPSRTDRRPIRRPELLRLYMDKVVNNVEADFGAQPLNGKRFVVDAANGAAKDITPHIFERLGARVDRFACDGQQKINEGSGAANLDGVQSFLMQHPEITEDPNFVGAVSNDGDADRMMAVGVKRSGYGQKCMIIDGNYVMGALAEGQPGIVGTLYTNSGLVEDLTRRKIAFESCANGDTYVTQALLERQKNGENWTRGGEFTGHHVDLGWLSSGDGVRMAAWFAAHAVKEDMTFADVHQNLSLWPEHMSKVTLPMGVSGAQVLAHPHVQARLEWAKAHMGDEGRLVVRPSGTEPVVRIWGESKKVDIQQVVTGVAAVVSRRAAQ